MEDKRGLRALKVSSAIKRLLVVIVVAVAALAIYSELDYFRTEDLQLAAARNDVRGIRRLAALGVNINGIDESGDSALFAAVYNGNYEAAEVLVSLGARAKLRSERGTPFEIARDDKMRRILKKAVDWR